MQTLTRTLSILYLLLASFPLIAQSPKPIFKLDASVGIKKTNTKVSEWADPVRNIKATQTNPSNQADYINQSIGGSPAVRFNGSSTFMNMPSIFPVNKNYTIIVVCKANGPSNNILGGTTHTLWMSGATTPKILHNGDFTNQVISSYDPGLEPIIIIAQYNQSTQIGRLVINGIYEDSSFCPINTDNTIYISAYQGGYFFNGDISEIQLYDSYLNEKDQKLIEAELKSKYKISNPPLPDSTFTNIPSNYQFYARDSNDESSFLIDGTINIAGFDSIFLYLAKEKALLSKSTIALDYSHDGKAPFSFNPKIKSELANYSIEIKLKNQQKDSSIAIRDHLVSGDVYIINGQSNSIFGGNPYSNEFCRTFGKNNSANKSDTLWTMASAVGYGGGPDIGAWGMELARQLISEYKVPICILNGGVGGTSIQQHQRNDLQPESPVNIYGSLLYRAQKSKLAAAAKAIFWYQGESNNSVLYFENFKSLYEDWKMDYPNIKKIFVVQIHHGCGAGDHAAVREIQRKLPKSFPDIEVISTMGLQGHDGCHYTLDGYLELAKNLFPLVQKEFYQGPDHPDLHAPNINQAFFSRPDFSEIILVFQPPLTSLILPGDTLINSQLIQLKDYFALDNQWKLIKNLRVHQDSLFLELKIPQSASTINYLPELTYLDFNATYQGPYLLNKNGIGALTFNKQDIEKQIPTGINQNFELSKNELKLFPVPGNKSSPLYIQTNFENSLDHIEIIFNNAFGERVYSKKMESLSSGKNIIEIELPIYHSDILFWEFKSGKYYKAGKWIIL